MCGVNCLKAMDFIGYNYFQSSIRVDQIINFKIETKLPNVFF